MVLSDSDSDFESPTLQNDPLRVSKECCDKKITTECDKLDAIDRRLKSLEAKLSTQSEVGHLWQRMAKLEAENHAISKCVCRLMTELIR